MPSWWPWLRDVTDVHVKSHSPNHRVRCCIYVKSYVPVLIPYSATVFIAHYSKDNTRSEISVLHASQVILNLCNASGTWMHFGISIFYIQLTFHRQWSSLEVRPHDVPWMMWLSSLFGILCVQCNQSIAETVMQPHCFSVNSQFTWVVCELIGKQCVCVVTWA